MTRFILSALVFVAVGVAAADEATDKALKALEGEYAVKSLEKDGKPAPDEILKKISAFIIKGDTITIKEEGGDKTATVKIDASKKPAHFDVSPKDEADTLKGIYKLEKGELTMVLTKKGERPTEFTATGKDIMKVVVVRKEKDQDK